MGNDKGKAIACYFFSVGCYAGAAGVYDQAQQKVNDISNAHGPGGRDAIVKAIENESGAACFLAFMGLVLWAIASGSHDWDVWYTISWVIFAFLIMQLGVMVFERDELVTRASTVQLVSAAVKAPGEAASGAWGAFKGLFRR